MGPPAEGRGIVRETAKPRRDLVTGTALLAAARVDGRWGKAALAAGVALSAACVAVFILTRQPYAGITCFALLAAKAVMLWMRDR